MSVDLFNIDCVLYYESSVTYLMLLFRTCGYKWPCQNEFLSTLIDAGDQWDLSTTTNCWKASVINTNGLQSTGKLKETLV